MNWRPLERGTMKSWWSGPFLPGVDYSDHVGRVFARCLCQAGYRTAYANDRDGKRW